MFDQVEETAPIGPIPRKKKFHGRVLERRTKKKRRRAARTKLSRGAGRYLSNKIITGWPGFV